MIKKIVYDIDDTLWGLNKKVSEILGIDENKITSFRIRENHLLSKEIQEAILNEYHKDSTFENIVWYEGVEDILMPEEFGSKIFINSNCLTERMIYLKKTQLLSVVDIPEQNIKCNIIDHSKAMQKEIDKDTDILIEDSPYNIAISPAKINIVINHPWNMSESANEIMKSKNIIRFDTLKEANRYIYTLCKEQQ